MVVAWWPACQAWQPFSPFGSHNGFPFEDETPVLVAFSEEPFMGWGGFSLCLLNWVLSHSNVVPTHPHTHTLACGGTVVAVSFVSVASGSASGACSDGASDWPCLVIREPEPFGRRWAPLTWSGPANHKHFIWYSVVSQAEGTACACLSPHWLEILSVF